jgi:hypothetical protein
MLFTLDDASPAFFSAFGAARLRFGGILKSFLEKQNNKKNLFFLRFAREIDVVQKVVIVIVSRTFLKNLVLNLSNGLGIDIELMSED